MMLVFRLRWTEGWVLSSLPWMCVGEWWRGTDLPEFQRACSHVAHRGAGLCRWWILLMAGVTVGGVGWYRYMTEVRRIALPPGDVEPVLHGFRELEEILQG